MSVIRPGLAWNNHPLLAHLAATRCIIQYDYHPYPNNKNLPTYLSLPGYGCSSRYRTHLSRPRNAQPYPILLKHPTFFPPPGTRLLSSQLTSLMSADQALSYLRSSLSSSCTKFSNRNPSTPLQQWQTYLETYLLSPLSSLLTAANSSTNPIDILTTTVLLLISLFLFFKIANYVRRLVMWWVVFLVKVVLLYALVVVGWSVWNRGFETTVRDLAGLWGFLEGVVRWMGWEVGVGLEDLVGKSGRENHGYGYERGYGSRPGYGYSFGGGRQQVPIQTRRRGGWA